MKITWVTRSFSNYRIPVYAALDKLCGHELTVIYYKDAAPQRAQEKLKQLLGNRAIARNKEIRFGNGKKHDNATTMKRTFRVPLSPGLVKQTIATKPEALLSDGFMQWTYAPLFVRALKKVPHVMCYERTIHTERNTGRLRTMYRKFVARWIDTIDCNGSLCAAYVKQLLGWDESRLSYGHMVADVKGMASAWEKMSEVQVKDLRTQLGVTGTMLLFVGQLIDRKGVMELLRAWSVFKKRCTVPCSLVFVGTGSRKDDMLKTIACEHIPDVIMIGVIDYELLPLYYKAADCFVLPTIEDNWSLVVPEAMACSLPVATTIYNGCYPELVTSKNGWIFDSLKQEDVVVTFERIIENRDNLKAMGKESQRIVSEHTAERAATGIMEAIEKARAHCAY